MAILRKPKIHSIHIFRRCNPITEKTDQISNNRNPSISIITPTYNSAKTLTFCLDSIKTQDYKGDIEIIIADGGSTDSTLVIARKYTDKLYPNPLKTGEAGKAAGVKHAKNEIIALIDSDNILPSRDWLSRMTEPFQDREIAGTEPLYYTYRKEDGYITRYCAMLGMNDPLCLFMGNYDRMCMVKGKWTEMPVIEEDKGNYIKIELDDKKLPIGVEIHVYTIILLPLLYQLLRGYWRRQDRAWWFHIPACWIMMAVYAGGTLRNFYAIKPEDIKNWQAINKL